MERMMGIEPTWPAWKAEVLPLNYIRNKNGVPERNRTFDPLIKSQLLYRLSYRDNCDQQIGWGTWGRTREMTESKSVALPLGYAPIAKINGGEGQIRTAEPVGN